MPEETREVMFGIALDATREYLDLCVKEGELWVLLNTFKEKEHAAQAQIVGREIHKVEKLYILLKDFERVPEEICSSAGKKLFSQIGLRSRRAGRQRTFYHVECLRLKKLLEEATKEKWGAYYKMSGVLYEKLLKAPCIHNKK